MTTKELRDIARQRLDNMGVTGVGYRAEEMLEWKVADRIEALEAELAVAKAEVEPLTKERDEARDELAAAKADASRVRTECDVLKREGTPYALSLQNTNALVVRVQELEAEIERLRAENDRLIALGCGSRAPRRRGR